MEWLEEEEESKRKEAEVGRHSIWNVGWLLNVPIILRSFHAMPIPFYWKWKSLEGQELADALVPPLSTSLIRSINLLQSPNHLPLPLPNKNPKARLRRACGLICYNNDLGVVSV